MTLPHVDDLDLVWRALGNPLRRRVLDVLRAGPASTGEIAQAIQCNRFVTMQHLQILRTADLVVVERQGRKVINHLNAIPIQQIHERWITSYSGQWASALVGMKAQMEIRTAAATRSPERQQQPRGA